MRYFLAVASAAVLSLSAASSASAATEHFLNNEAVSNGGSRASAAHGSGTNRYSVYAHGLTSDAYVCVRIDGVSYICSGIEQDWTFSASGLIKGWAYNGTGRTINMNAHMTYGQ